MIENSENFHSLVSDVFSSRILDEIDCVALLMYPIYKKSLSDRFPDMEISSNFLCYTGIISKIYEKFEGSQTDDDPLESFDFQALENFVEISELCKIRERSKIGNFLSFLKWEDADMCNIDTNFITSLFPGQEEKLEE